MPVSLPFRMSRRISLGWRVSIGIAPFYLRPRRGASPVPERATTPSTSLKAATRSEQDEAPDPRATEAYAVVRRREPEGGQRRHATLIGAALYLRPRRGHTSGFTRTSGFSPRSTRSISPATCTAICLFASCVTPATCEEQTTCSRFRSGLSTGVGSSSQTSRPAAARWPRVSASKSARSSCTGPREVLTKIAPGFNVWEEEPTPVDNPLLNLEQVVCSSH